MYLRYFVRFSHLPGALALAGPYSSLEALRLIPTFFTTLRECHTDSNDCCRNHIYRAYHLLQYGNGGLDIVASAYGRLKERGLISLEGQGRFYCLDLRSDPLPLRESHRLNGPYFFDCTSPLVMTQELAAVDFELWDYAPGLPHVPMHAYRLVCKDVPDENIGTVKVVDEGHIMTDHGMEVKNILLSLTLTTRYRDRNQVKTSTTQETFETGPRYKPPDWRLNLTDNRATCMDGAPNW